MSIEYIEALSKGVSVCKYITHVNLRNTNLTTRGAILIVESLIMAKIVHLDLSYNPQLAEECYRRIGSYVYDENCNLEFLSFEGNRMGDQNLEILSPLIMQSVRLKVLNLSKNEIQDKSS